MVFVCRVLPYLFIVATFLVLGHASFAGRSLQACASIWEQCGGQGFTGATCCQQSTCVQQNPYYSQCLQDVPVPTLTPTLAPIEPYPVVQPPVGSPVARHGALSTVGNKLVDEHGQVVQLHGMSLFWSQWPEGSKYYTQKTIQWLSHDWRITLVRAAMGVSTDGYLSFPQREKMRVQTVVNAAIDLGLYVIVDWHDHHADEHADLASAFFREMAMVYGHLPNVLFETFNEPVRDASLVNVIKPYHEQIVPVIRQHSQNLIILGSSRWSQDVDVASADPVVGSSLAYSLHFYVKAQGARLRNKVRQALYNGVAVFATEWGTCYPVMTHPLNSQPIVPNEIEEWLRFLRESHISEANWAISDKNKQCTALYPGASPEGGWVAGLITPSGTFVRQALRELPDMPPVMVQTMAGCPRNFAGLHPKACNVALASIHAPASNRMSVRCCSNNGVRVPMTEYGCHTKKTYQEAHEICASRGYHICTEPELAGNSVCGAGCGFDGHRVWTSSFCMPSCNECTDEPNHWMKNNPRWCIPGTTVAPSKQEKARLVTVDG